MLAGEGVGQVEGFFQVDGFDDASLMRERLLDDSAAGGGRVWTWSATSRSTASARAWSGVMSNEHASGSCSACASKSAATQAGVAESSAMTRHSVGPGRASIPTWPKTMRLASTTNMLPG